MGPVAHAHQLETNREYVEVGKSEGARLCVGGDLEDGDGYYFRPTVFDEVNTQMRIAQEEIFGPIVGIIRAGGFDDAVEKANSVAYGLSAGVVTNDLEKAFAFADVAEAGVVKVNEPTNGVALNAPFGGFKNSSANTFKEQGEAAVHFFTRTKSVYIHHGNE